MEQTRSAQRTIKLGDKRRINFYASVFDEVTTVYDYRPGETARTWYKEVIKPGAFTQALQSPEEVIANVDHDPGRTFAQRSDGSLLLQEDPFGLFASAWVPDDKLGDQILSDVEAGRLTGCSFRFVDVAHQWAGDTLERRAVMLRDVCVTATPAYSGAEILRTQAYLSQVLARYRYMKWKLTH